MKKLTTTAVLPFNSLTVASAEPVALGLVGCAAETSPSENDEATNRPMPSFRIHADDLRDLELRVVDPGKNRFPSTA